MATFPEILAAYEAAVTELEDDAIAMDQALRSRGVERASILFTTPGDGLEPGKVFLSGNRDGLLYPIPQPDSPIVPFSGQ